MKHDVGDVKVFKCDACDYKCLRRGELTDHVRFKHEKRPMICQSCNRKYFDKKSLRDHVKKRHTT